MTARDPRIVAAVRQVISDVQRSVAPSFVEARFFERWRRIQLDDAMSPSARWALENDEGLRIIAELGFARGAALKAARRICPDNPHARHSLAQRFRRLVRQKKNAQSAPI